MNDSIKNTLKQSSTIAIYGASTNKDKDSFKVMKFLQGKGFIVLPINPYAINDFILGEKVFKSLQEIDKDIDILNIFRPSSEVLDITKQAINKNIKTIWLQLDIICKNSQNLLEKKEISFYQNKCIKIEYIKLFNDN